MRRDPTPRTRSGALSDVLIHADDLARADAATEVTTSHLLLAVMGASRTIWPGLISEHGGMRYADGRQRLGLRKTRVNQLGGRQPVRPSVWLLLCALVLGSALRAWRRLRRWRGSSATGVDSVALPLAGSAADVLSIASQLAENRNADAAEGDLLVALASTPGRHLRLLDNSNLVAAAARRELGIAEARHRALLACGWPTLALNRARAGLQRRVSANGWASRWGLARASFAIAGFIWANVRLSIVVATLALYVFLWPAVMLVNGCRALVARTLGCEVFVHRWHEIPGGEARIESESDLSVTRVASIVLIPRFVALVACVVGLVFVGWRAQRLGVITFPTIYARPDALVGSPDLPGFPFIEIFADPIENDGALTGIGVLACLGAGFMSVPTFREIQLVRLHGQHDIGRGGTAARALSLPAYAVTGAFACIEALLPLRGGPMYITAFVVPLAFALLCAAAVIAALPY